MKKAIITLIGLLFLVGCVKKPIEIITFEVTFISNGGTDIAKKAVNENDTLAEPHITKQGFEFEGWFVDANFKKQWDFINDKVVSDLTLYAKWKEIEVINESMASIFEKLSQTIYKQHITYQDEYDLNPSSIGINQTQFESEIRYPIPETNVIKYKVSAYNILPENSDNTNAMNALLTTLKTVEGVKVIEFDAGVYKFKETIVISGIHDLYIVGKNTTWLMTSWLTLIQVTNAKNFHINTMDFDYEISPSITGHIHATNPLLNEVVIDVNDEFDLTNHRYNNGSIKYGNYMEYVYDKTFKAYIPDKDGMLRYNSTGDQINGISYGSYDAANKQLTLRFNDIQGPFKQPEIGKTVSVAFTMYEYPGFIIASSENIYFETVNIYTTPGMSIMGKSSRNLYFNRTNIMLKEGSTRLMTATADGLHLGDCLGEVVISNSLYEASHDDSINIKTFYFKVDTFSRNTMTVSMTTTEIRIPIEVGDRIEIFDGSSLLGKLTRKVTKVESYGTSYEITLDQNVSPTVVGVGDLVGNISRVPSVTIENSIFRNKRNRGILLQARDSKIINNVFYNILHGPIMIHAAKDIFSEAIVPKHIEVKHNKFYQNNGLSGTLGDIAVFRAGGSIVENVITDIDITNNYFKDSAQSAIYLAGTGNVNIMNNLIDSPALKISNASLSNSAIGIRYALNTAIKNTILKLGKIDNAFEAIRHENANNIQIEDPIILDDRG